MTSNYKFRSSVVGGFNRGDVVAYIEKLSADHRREIADLQNKLASETGSERERLTAELQHARTELTAKRAECDRLAAALRETRERHDALVTAAAEIDAHRQELERAKAHIAGIELAAVERASVIEQAARENAARIRESLVRLHGEARAGVEGMRGAVGEVAAAFGSVLERLGRICDETGSLPVEPPVE